MPIYKYQCPAGCGVFERIQTMSRATSSTDCDCGENSPRTLSTARWMLRHDNTQAGGFLRSGWEKPGMSGIDYTKVDKSKGFRGNHMISSEG